MPNTVLNFLAEAFKYTIGPIVGATIAYWFLLKGKKKDVDHQKTRELNTVLSNMLNSWHYLNKLSDLLKFSEDKTNDLLLPKEYLPFFILKSGALNDNCFNELDKSIETLKQYDPVSYFELEGIGKKFDYVKKNCIIPFLQANKKGDSAIQIVSRTLLDKLLNDLEQYLRNTAALISSETLRKIEKKIDKNFDNNFDELKEEFNNEYYALIISVIPNNIRKPTYEEFKIDFKRPEVQEQLKKELEFIMNTGMDTLITLITQNPTMSIEEFNQALNRTNQAQQ